MTGQELGTWDMKRALNIFSQAVFSYGNMHCYRSFATGEPSQTKPFQYISRLQSSADFFVCQVTIDMRENLHW